MMTFRPLVIAIALAACGDNTMAVPDSAGTNPDAPSGFMMAPHTALPDMIPHSGTILAHAQLITLTYTGYADAAAVGAWGDAAVVSAWYTAVGADYGVLSGTNQNITIGAAPTTTLEDTQIEAKIKALIAAHTLPTPVADSEYVYMIYIPPTVPLGNSLQGFYGYHQQSSINGQKFAMAVILDDGTGIDTTTVTSAHELIEAATDPYDAPSDGYYTDPALPDPWWLISGEVGDLCDGEAYTHEGGKAYQRIWSRSRAAANQNPCIPDDGEDLWVDVSASPATMPTIAKGTSTTFTLTGWSTAATADWALDTYTADYSDLDTSVMNPTFSAPMINNGKTVTLTLSAPANAHSGDIGGVYILSGDLQRPWAVGFTVQ